jgi:hypothetical protein
MADDHVDPPDMDDDPALYQAYPHWRNGILTYPWPQNPDHPDPLPENPTPEQIAQYDAEHGAYVDAMLSPLNREWIVRTLGLLTSIMRVGSGREDNYDDPEARKKERLAIACIALANVAMTDGPPVVLTAFARTAAKKMDALGLFNPASGDADADDFIEEGDAA